MYEVLIVDDEPMICAGLEMMVDWEKYHFAGIRKAYNGAEACEEIEKKVPDLLITDIRMPKMDGIELLKSIRERELDIRIIVLSGYDDFEYVRAMAVLGIENYLLKPVNEEEIILNVSNVSHKIHKEKEMKLRSQMDISIIKENIINRWLYGAIGEKELQERADFLELNLEAERYQPFLLRKLGEEIQDSQVKNDIYGICASVLREWHECYYFQNHAGDTIVIWSFAGGTGTDTVIDECLNKVERETGIKLYAIVGNEVKSCFRVGNSFREAEKNGIYRNESGADRWIAGSDLERNLAPFTIRMAKYALEHYHEELSLKILAKHFKVNAAYIGQNFRKDTGKSFSDYVREIRIKKAKEMLLGHDNTAKEIGVKVGFLNDAYFSATFKKETGLTPAEYRKEFLK